MITLTSDNFSQEVLQSDKPVLVDFWAPWCGPCRIVGPILEEVAKEQTAVQIAKLNVDEAQALAAEYGVMSIPTILLFSAGQVVDEMVGIKPGPEETKAAILALIKQGTPA